MTKFILPLLVFACAGFSQGKEAPKVDPSTGLPKLVDGIDEKLADILQGASRENVAWEVFDEYSNLDARLKESIETKFKLGMKRNKLSRGSGIFVVGSYSHIRVEVSTMRLGTRLIGYTWGMYIGRFVNTKSGEKIQKRASWKVAGGIVGSSADLKEEIDSTLDKIFLAYLELPEVKEKTVEPRTPRQLAGSKIREAMIEKFDKNGDGKLDENEKPSSEELQEFFRTQLPPAKPKN